MTDVIIARALHVLAVIFWIGGVAMVTTVILPAVRRRAFGDNQIQAFQAIEHRFGRQARIAVLIVGLTGVYMTARLDLWERFRSADFWWMHAMVCLWLLFMFVLFVAEPLFVRRRFSSWATTSPDTAFAWLYRVHWVLLLLSLLTVFGAVSGSQGWRLF